MLKEDLNRLKEKYMVNTQGYTYDEKNNVWYTPENKPMTQKEFEKARKGIDRNKALDAATSGEYYLDSIYKDYIMPTFTQGSNFAKTYGLNSTSQDYVTRAMLKLQSGEADKEFFDLLTDEEKKVLSSNQY